MKINRYELIITDYQTWTLPQDSKFLKAEPWYRFLGPPFEPKTKQIETLSFWAEHPIEDAPMVLVEFRVVGTDNQTDNNLMEGFKYCDSVRMPSGLAWHIYSKNLG